jgi:hypothetical protein
MCAFLEEPEEKALFCHRSLLEKPFVIWLCAFEFFSFSIRHRNVCHFVCLQDEASLDAN